MYIMIMHCDAYVLIFFVLEKKMLTIFRYNKLLDYSTNYNK